MVEIAIIGNGSHGLMLKAIFKDQAEFFTPDKLPSKIFICIGVGNAPKIGNSDLLMRQNLFQRYNSRLVGICHPTSVVLGDVDSTCQIMPTAVINFNAIVRGNVIINTAAVIEHNCNVGPHCHIAPNATLCGAVTIEELTHIGAGAVVLQGIKIGSNCVVGAGSVVTKNMPNNTTWIGTKFCV